MTVEERIARIKEHKNEYRQLLDTVKNKDVYYNWLQNEMVSTSTALERRQSTTIYARQMGATQEDIDRVYALEDRNHHDAFFLMMDLTAMQMPFTEHLITSLHNQVLKDIDNYNAGCYRRETVRLLNSSTVLPHYIKVPVLMKELVDSVNNSTKDVIPQSFDMHHQFVAIHPFVDGNGRTARLLMNFNLMKNDYFPVVIHPKKRGEYLDSLEAMSVHNDQNKYYSFMLGEMETTFKTCMDEMISLPRTSTPHSMAIVSKHQKNTTLINNQNTKA